MGKWFECDYRNAGDWHRVKFRLDKVIALKTTSNNHGNQWGSVWLQGMRSADGWFIPYDVAERLFGLLKDQEEEKDGAGQAEQFGI